MHLCIKKHKSSQIHIFGCSREKVWVSPSRWTGGQIYETNDCCWWPSFFDPKLKRDYYFWNTRYQETDTATFKSHWRCHLFHILESLKTVSWNPLHIPCFFSLSCNSGFLSHVSAWSFDWTVQTNQTCWVFQK